MEIPQNAVTKLRVMTRKSRFDFGKHSDMTVQDVLIANSSYVPFVYYNISSLSFSDDILDELQIIRIEKPGVDKETWRQYKRMVSEQYTPEQRLHGLYRRAMIKKAMRKNAEVRTAHSLGALSTKGRLQSKNHGRG